MATYPSGLTRAFPEPDDFPTTAAWGVQLELALEDQPLGPTAACMNPECINPVDYAPSGSTLIYCSHYCRTRASDLRQRITQQLRVIDAALGPDHARAKGLPRAALQRRAHHLNWWLMRLTPGREAPERGTARDQTSSIGQDVSSSSSSSSSSWRR